MSVRSSFALAFVVALAACGDVEPVRPSAERTTGGGLAERAADEVDRGRELAEAGDVELAEDAFRRAVELDPSSAPASFYLGTTLVLLAHVQGAHAEDGGAGVSLGRDDAMMDEGIASLARAVELAPQDTAYRYELGRALHVRGRNAEAVAELERLVELDPEDGAAYKRLGLVHLDDGELERARAALRVAERLLPEDAGVPYQLGNALLEEDPAAAREAFRRSIAVDPTFPPPHHGLVGVLARLGDAEGAQEARAEFERARRFRDRAERAERRANKRTDDAEAQAVVGDLWFAKGRWKEAAEFYGRALALDPRDAHSHFRMGHIAVELDELDAARNHFEEALFLTPDALEPRIELVRVCERQNDRERREELLAEIRAADASLSVDGRLLFGDVLLELGEREGARAQFERVVREDAGHAEARERLARLAGERGGDGER